MEGPAPNAPDPASEPEEGEALKSALRRAVFRAVILGAGLAGITLLVGALLLVLSPHPIAGPRDVLAFLVGISLPAAFAGSLAAPLAFVEFRAAGRPQTLARDLTAVALAAFFALAGVIFVGWEFVYVQAVFEEQSVAEGFAAIMDATRDVLVAPVELNALVLYAAPFPALVLARIHERGALGQLVFTLAGGTALALPSFVAYCSSDAGPHGLGAATMGAMFLTCYALVVFAASGADVLEKRAAAWLARRRAAG